MLRPAAPVAALLLAAACASAPATPPSSVTQGAVLAPVRVERIVFKSRLEADRGFLVPLDAAGKLEADRPIAASFAADGLLYFLDLPPGRYAPAALSYPAHGLRFRAKLKAEESLAAAVVVRPGEVVYLGELVLQRHFQGWGVFFANGLRHLAWVLHPWRRPQAGFDYSVKFQDRSAVLETAALQAARKTLAGTGWELSIDRRLAQINMVPERPMESGGLFHKAKPLPYQETDLFSYVDTLGWGKPAVVAGGFEWRQPKDRARIHLSLVDEKKPGARPLAQFLRRLKEQGSAEDTHTLREVVLSSGPAVAARYTSYHYPEPYLTGAVVQVSVTETLVAADPRGYFIVQLRSSQDDFAAFYPDFQRFLSLLRLKRGKPRQEYEP